MPPNFPPISYFLIQYFIFIFLKMKLHNFINLSVIYFRERNVHVNPLSTLTEELTDTLADDSDIHPSVKALDAVLNHSIPSKALMDSSQVGT